jgi:hypothetical protein
MNPAFAIALSKPIKTMKPRPVSRGWLRSAVCLVLTAVAFALGSARTFAQATPNPPDRLTYQGFLVDGNGVALGNSAPKNYDVIFRIYTDQTAGALLWAEQQTVTVDKGYFSVLLGEGASTGEPRPGLSTLFKGPTASDRFVGITVKGIGAGGGNQDISPRLRLLTSPYAFLAEQAVKLVRTDNGNDLITSSGNAITVNGTVTASTLSGNGASVTAINAGNISSGTLGDARLSANVALRSGGNTFSGNQVFNNSVQANGYVGIAGNNTMEFGTGLSKEGSAGKIGYGIFVPDALNIVGAGTTGSNRKLQVYAEGGANFTGPVTANSFSGNGSGLSSLNAGNITSGVLSLNQIPGDVVRSTTGNGLTFRVSGDTIQVFNFADKAKYFQMFRYASGVAIQGFGGGWGNASGDFRQITWDGDGNWDAASDRKMKRDIVDAEPVLDRALQVQVRRFRWKNDPADAKLTLGVIAQELQPLFPDLIAVQENPTTKETNLAVGYSDFGMIAVKAIQELKVQQDKEIADLKSQMADLKSQMAEVLRVNAELRIQSTKKPLTAAGQ